LPKKHKKKENISNNQNFFAKIKLNQTKSNLFLVENKTMQKKKKFFLKRRERDMKKEAPLLVTK